MSNAPSISRLMEGLKISRMQARDIRGMIHAENPQTLSQASDYMKKHGVETLWNADGFPVLDYVNTGETYEVTLCFRIKTSTWSVMSWGDFVETQERNGKERFK